MNIISYIILTLAGLIIYFIPALVGCQKRNRVALFIANLCFGWTGLGWAVCLIWAICYDREAK